MVYTFTVVEHEGKLFMGSWKSTSGLFDMFENTDYAFWNHRALHMFGLTALYLYSRVLVLVFKGVNRSCG